MSHEDLLFESFLNKRKDKMKFNWVTYWFRLQNTTLFFYTKQHGGADCLRGQYYVYSIQSVREIEASDNKYLFEIVMKNGKKKMLSADSAELRAIWMEFLWKAMQLPGPGRDESSCTWHDIPHLLHRAEVNLGKDNNSYQHDRSSVDSTGSTVPSLPVMGRNHDRSSVDSTGSMVPFQIVMARKSANVDTSGYEASDEEDIGRSEETELYGSF
ncbi:uncharacterized protein LOC122800112 [Protopterus annectens]|uniref:uncharacterized protein LOC122800112 n=1 Tax=Protopterus annectens TaxID=7888 RepID=UPI001CFA93A5|nr:uncharacterized protein LOC122800112 [Protopterus annectens]